MAAPPYQKLFWGSYHKHTAHLRHAREHGAYLLLIGALWNNDGKLPADDETLASYAMVGPKEWAAIRPKLMPMFSVSRGKLTQPRVTEDLAKYKSTSGKRKEAGKAGGNASAGKHKGNGAAIATVLPTKPEPESEPKERELKLSLGDPPIAISREIEFETWWALYPRKTGKLAGRKAYDAARKRGATADQLRDGLGRTAWSTDPRYIPHPATWLNEGRWMDAEPAAAAAPIPKRVGFV
jgi:uncharacterized protein YdaU (DUF1376 family)